MNAGRGEHKASTFVSHVRHTCAKSCVQEYVPLALWCTLPTPQTHPNAPPKHTHTPPPPTGQGGLVDHGVHAFIVPLRDDAGRCLPGVEIHDCGYKVGLSIPIIKPHTLSHMAVCVACCCCIIVLLALMTLHLLHCLHSCPLRLTRRPAYQLNIF